MTTTLTFRQALAVHGLFGNGEPLQRLLGHAGLTPTTVDATRPWAPSLSAWASDIEHALWAQDHTTRILVAHSLGAIPTLRAATIDPTARVILLNPHLTHTWVTNAMTTLDPRNVTVIVGSHDVVTRRQGTHFARAHGANLLPLEGVTHSGFLPGIGDIWPAPVFELERIAHRILRHQGPALPHQEQFSLVAHHIRQLTSGLT